MSVDRRPRGAGRGRIARLLVIVSCVTTACLGPAYERAREARARYDECLAEHASAPERCDEEREVARREWDRYEREAQRTWRRRPGDPGDDVPYAPNGAP